MNSKAKGSAFERDVSKQIEAFCGIKTKRNLEQTRSGGADLVGFPGWVIECKIRKDGAWIQECWWSQVLAESQKLGLRPALIFRVSRQPIRVMFFYQVEGEQIRIVTGLEDWVRVAARSSGKD